MNFNDHRNLERSVTSPPLKSGSNHSSVPHTAPSAVHHHQQQQFSLGPASTSHPQHLGLGHENQRGNCDHLSSYRRTATPIGHSHGQREISPFDYHHSSVSSNGIGVDGERSSSYDQPQHLDQGGQMQGHLHGHAREYQNQQQQGQSSSFESLPQVPGHDLYEQQQHYQGQTQGQNRSIFQQQQQPQHQEYCNLPQHYQESMSHSQTHNHASQGHRQQAQSGMYHQHSQTGSTNMNFSREAVLPSSSSGRTSSKEHMNGMETASNLQVAAMGIPEFQQQRQHTSQSNSLSHRQGHISPMSRQHHQHHSRSPDDFSPITSRTLNSQMNVPFEQHQRGHHPSKHQADYDTKRRSQHDQQQKQQQSHHQPVYTNTSASIGIRGGELVDQQQQQQQQHSRPNYQQHKLRSPDFEQNVSIPALPGTNGDNSTLQKDKSLTSIKVAGSASSSNTKNSMPSMPINLPGAQSASVAKTSIGEKKGDSGSKPFVTSTRGKGNGPIRGSGHGGTRNPGGPIHQKPVKSQSPSNKTEKDVKLQKRQQEYIRGQMALPEFAKLIQADQNVVHNQTESWWETFQSDINKGLDVVSRDGSMEYRVKYYQDASQMIQNYRRASQGEKMNKLRRAKKMDPMTMFGMIKREIQLIKVACNAVSGVLRKYYYSVKDEHSGRLILKDEKKISIRMAKWAQDIEVKLQAVILRSRSILQGAGALHPTALAVNSTNDVPIKGDGERKKSSSSKKKKRPDNKDVAPDNAGNKQKDNRKGSNTKLKKTGSTNRKSKDTKSKKVEKEYTREIIITKQESPSSPNVINLKKNPNGPIITIKDQFPDRITNPLLELPHGSMSGDPTMTVSEYLRYIEVYFPVPDTYPVSFYAKLLGIGIPKNLSIAENESATKDAPKDDNWHNIPPLGKYGSLEQIRNVALDSIDLKNSRCGQDQDFVDPVWRSILKDYQGYKDEVFRPATEFHKPCEISATCLEFAREVNIVDSRICFRVATLEDVTMINEFNKDEKCSLSLERLCQIMKCGHHFILLATDSEKRLMGCIHYQFCWFKPKSQCVLSGEDVALERVVHIESIKCRRAETQIREISVDAELVGVYLVLLGLALEHCRLHVGYGMMELPSLLSNPLKKFFRMSEITTNRQKSNDNRVLMACDLEKCSYRYSFLVGQKVLNLKRSRKIPNVKYRLIAQLPTCRKEKSEQGVKSSEKIAQSEGSTSSNFGNSFRETPDSNHQVRDKLGSFFSGIETTRKHKKVVVHIEKGKVNVRRYNKNLSPQKKGFRLIAKGDNWIPISCFTSRIHENPVPSSTDQFNIDTVLCELKKQQEKLIELEKSNSYELHNLLHRVVDERMHFETGNTRKSRIAAEKTIAEYEAAVQRRNDAQKALELQQEEEENAVCDICGDGESTGENRIIFCDACDLSVHQHCYGIEKVPRGDYFCRACLYYKREKQSDQQIQASSKSKPPDNLKTTCELCPRRQGAFVQCQNISDDGNQSTKKAKWVHLLCAKWQGLNYVDYYVNGIPDLMVEDVQPLKNHFNFKQARCFLCKGSRGSFNQCSHEGCDKMLHVTCARASGICEVNHGIDHTGPVESDKNWKLFCPEHSSFEPDYTPPSNKLSIEELIANAKKFPPETKPKPPPKAFNRMNGKERKEYFKNPENERQIYEIVLKNTTGLRCAVCDLTNSNNNSTAIFLTCSICGSTAHEACIVNPWQKKPQRDNKFQVICTSCTYVEEHKNDDDYDVPQCHMCNSHKGTLIDSFAKPVTMKKWKRDLNAFKKSLFGKKIWCHPVCAIWNSKVHIDDRGVADCSNIVMANGVKHIQGKQFCVLCGRQDKAKVQCNHPHKKNAKGCKAIMHATCARQAGLEVSSPEGSVYNFRCFQHSECSFTFRAFLEDMIEFEKLRSGNGLTATGKPMSNECVSNIFNSGIRVLNSLGWAWQWASWWVRHGDNWEPFLEPGEVEENMTDEELRKVESTPTSRREDARKCRLAAFGAALRNRSYDKEKGDNMVPLSNALRAIMSTPSLVGPLMKVEIEFFVDWLGRIYRSKSPLLGFGDAKIPVAEKWTNNCPVFFEDKSAKFELGARPLPGKQCLRKGQIFEEGITEIDDYFKEDETPLSLLLSATPNTANSENSVSSITQTSSSRSRPRSHNSRRKENVVRINIESSRPKKRKASEAKIHNSASDGETENVPARSKTISNASILKKRDRQPTLCDPIPKKRKPTLDDPIPKKRGKPSSSKSEPSQKQLQVENDAIPDSGRPLKKRGPGRPPKKSSHAKGFKTGSNNDQNAYSRSYSPKRRGPGRKR